MWEMMISFTLAKCSLCFVYLYEVFLGDAFGPLYTHLRSSTRITDVCTLYQHALNQRAVFRGGQLVYNCHAVGWACPTLKKEINTINIIIERKRERQRDRESLFVYFWITIEEVSSSFSVLLLTQLTNLLRCSKCCFISVASTMSIMVSLRGVYSSLVRFLKILTELSFHDNWKPKAAWWFSRTALE